MLIHLSIFSYFDSFFSLYRGYCNTRDQFYNFGVGRFLVGRRRRLLGRIGRGGLLRRRRVGGAAGRGTVRQRNVGRVNNRQTVRTDNNGVTTVITTSTTNVNQAVENIPGTVGATTAGVNYRCNGVMRFRIPNRPVSECVELDTCKGQQ